LNSIIERKPDPLARVRWHQNDDPEAARQKTYPEAYSRGECHA